MDMTDLIVKTEEDYVEKAIQLANEPEYYETMSAKIKRRNAVLYDNDDAIKNWEQALVEIYEKHPFTPTIPTTASQTFPVSEIEEIHIQA
jgi:predicted O-linked N-acetylglucosamine transferase (SPINDLY family)